MGLGVRFDAFDAAATSRGGLCTLRGVPLVVVDANATTMDKVVVLSDAIRRFNIDALYVPPLLRARMQGGREG
jgi:hypothetical protein